LFLKIRFLALTIMSKNKKIQIEGREISILVDKKQEYISLYGS